MRRILLALMAILLAGFLLLCFGAFWWASGRGPKSIITVRSNVPPPFGRMVLVSGFSLDEFLIYANSKPNPYPSGSLTVQRSNGPILMEAKALWNQYGNRTDFYPIRPNTVLARMFSIPGRNYLFPIVYVGDVHLRFTPDGPKLFYEVTGFESLGSVEVPDDFPLPDE